MNVHRHTGADGARSVVVEASEQDWLLISAVIDGWLAGSAVSDDLVLRLQALGVDYGELED